MNKKLSKNLVMLQTIAQALAAVKIDAVFVGGVTIELYITDPAAPPLRPTEDVDCVVCGGTGVYFALEEHLRAAGLRHATEDGAPICRWRLDDVSVDIMPTDEKVLGFANRWYKQGVENAVFLQLPDGQNIRIFPLAYMLASKFEAFNNRGTADWYGSKDLEDIIALLDGVQNLEYELGEADAAVKKFLGQQFGTLLKNPELPNLVQGHIPSSEGPERTERCLKMLKCLANL